MSENQHPEGNPPARPDVEAHMADRRLAHERLSSGGLSRWMRACATHPWRVVFSWVGIIALLVVLVGTVGGSLKDDFEIPGSDTQKATDLIESEFVEEQGGVLNLVFAAPAGERLDTPERKAAVEAAIAKVKTDEFKPTGTDPDGNAGIESVGDPFSDNTFSDDGRIAYAEAQFDRVIFDKDRERVVAVEDAVRETVEPAGVTAEFNGDAEFPPIEQGTQELLGLLAALIVLLVVFRTLVATAIPLALAIVAVMSAFLLLFVLAGLTDINTITPLLVSMIGIGVGIDYSLFIVTRFRQYLHEGLSPQDAAAEAGASAGRAVIFAGLTVAISVTGLAFFGLDFVTKLGIGSALGVLTTVLIANSLLIAVLAKLGHKIDRLKVPFLRPIDDSEAAREKTLIARWGRFVTAHARGVFVVMLLVLLGLAATSALVRLGASDQGTQPTAQTARRAYDLLAEGFGPGFNGPIPIVVDVNGDAEAPQRVYDGVRDLDGVASAGEPQFNDAKTVALVFVTPDSAPQDEKTEQLVDTLRSDVVPAATEGGDAVVYVSGLNAAFIDIADRIMERLPLFLLYIIGVTFIVLAMAFRSIVISLTAAIEHLPVAGDQHRSILRYCRDSRELLALEQLERSAAARRDPGDARLEAELVDGPDGVTAAHDCEGVRVGDCLGDGLRAAGEPFPLEDPHRPVPEDRAGPADVPGEQVARGRADVQPEPARGQLVVGDLARLGVLGEGHRRDDVGRQHDLEREWVLLAQLLGHLPADEHGVGTPAQVLEHAELVLHLRPAGDEHEGSLDVAEQAPEHLQLPFEQEPRVGGQQVRDRLRGAVGAVGRAERVVHVEVASLRELAGEALVVARLAGIEAGVLEHLDARVGQERAQVLADGLDPETRVLALRPAEVRADPDAGDAAPEQVLERRQRRADARVVGDPAVLERDVQVGADEHDLPLDVSLPHGARPVVQSTFPIRSTNRQEYPHSLSYQPKIFTIEPFTIVSSVSKTHEYGERWMSVETIGSSMYWR